jgi:hypothetical protein
VNVYIVVHDDYEWAEVRAVYLSRENAEAALVDRTPSGRISEKWGAHRDGCCEIEEREVLDAPEPVAS